MLTEKQENFCREYIATGNATAAYRKSYNCDKSKPASVNRLAKANIDNIKIRARIKELQAEVAEKLLVSEESVLKEYARIGFSDVRQLFDEDGKLKPVHDLDNDTAAAISAVKVVSKNAGPGEVEYVHEYKMWAKTAALDSLGKNIGFFAKDNKQRQPLTVVSDEELRAKLAELRGE